MDAEISIDAWNWIYHNRDDVKFSPDKRISKFLNTFLKNGLLLFEEGHFILTDTLQKALDVIHKEELLLKQGLPINCKQTRVSPKEYQHFSWYRGRVDGRKPFFTNYEIIVFAPSFKGITLLDSPNLLEIELLISQVSRAVFREDYIDIAPAFIQREDYFEPGIIHLLGEHGYKISIDENYYDLITYHWSSVNSPCRFLATAAGKELVVVTNPHVHSRFHEDIIAIIGTCEIGDSICEA